MGVQEFFFFSRTRNSTRKQSGMREGGKDREEYHVAESPKGDVVNIGQKLCPRTSNGWKKGEQVEESNGESHVVTDKKQRGRSGKKWVRRGITESAGTDCVSPLRVVLSGQILYPRTFHRQKYGNEWRKVTAKVKLWPIRNNVVGYKEEGMARRDMKHEGAERKRGERGAKWLPISDLCANQRTCKVRKLKQIIFGAQ